MAFPIWIATEILCNRKLSDLGSPDAILIRLPSSLRKFPVSGPVAPHVSIATGWNRYMLSKWAYFLDFSVSACAAAPPGSLMALRRLDVQKVSGHVTSQTRYLPWDQGIIVIPSGRFPSERCSPEGSSLEGMFAAARE